jgi:hypothetical protein
MHQCRSGEEKMKKKTKLPGGAISIPKLNKNIKKMIKSKRRLNI